MYFNKLWRLLFESQMEEDLQIRVKCISISVIEKKKNNKKKTLFYKWKLNNYFMESSIHYEGNFTTAFRLLKHFVTHQSIIYLMSMRMRKRKFSRNRIGEHFSLRVENKWMRTDWIKN